MAELSLAAAARGKVLTPERAAEACAAMMLHFQQSMNGWLPAIQQANHHWAAGYWASFRDADKVFRRGIQPSRYFVRNVSAWPLGGTATVEEQFYPDDQDQLKPIMIFARRAFKQDSKREWRSRMARVRPGSFDGVEL